MLLWSLRKVQQTPRGKPICGNTCQELRGSGGKCSGADARGHVAIVQEMKLASVLGISERTISRTAEDDLPYNSYRVNVWKIEAVRG